jgi:DNA-binding transcriptional LysR family regulator
MDSDDLKTFLAIRTAGGFSRASEVLHRSQPAISRRIALLEEEIGAPLFERASGGVVLSQAGQVLLPHAERALAALEDGAAALRELRGGIAGPLRLTAVGTLAGAGLTPVLTTFAQKYPKARLSLTTATSTEVSEAVRRGEATIGLRYGHDRSNDLVSEQTGTERLVVACSPRHRRAGKRVKSLRDLKDEHWLAFANSGPVRESASDNLFAQFLVRGIGELAWTAIDSLTAQKRLAEAGFGLVLIPQSAVVEECAAKTLSLIEVRDLDASNPVCLVLRRGGYLSPAAVALVALLKTRPGRV